MSKLRIPVSIKEKIRMVASLKKNVGKANKKKKKNRNQVKKEKKEAFWDLRQRSEISPICLLRSFEKLRQVDLFK